MAGRVRGKSVVPNSTILYMFCVEIASFFVPSCHFLVVCGKWLQNGQIGYGSFAVPDNRSGLDHGFAKAAADIVDSLLNAGLPGIVRRDLLQEG